MPTLVLNRESGPTVFSDPKENIAIEWQGRGDPAGGDVQYVPDSLITENTNFLGALQRGIFEVVDATPEIQAKIDAQVSAYQRKRDASRAVADNAIDRTQNAPISTVNVDEKGKVTVVAEAEAHDADGKPLEVDIPVVIEPRRQA